MAVPRLVGVIVRATRPGTVRLRVARRKHISPQSRRAHRVEKYRKWQRNLSVCSAAPRLCGNTYFASGIKSTDIRSVQEYYNKSRGMEQCHSRLQTSSSPSQARTAAHSINVSFVHDIRIRVSTRVRQPSRAIVCVWRDSATALSGSSPSSVVDGFRRLEIARWHRE